MNYSRFVPELRLTLHTFNSLGVDNKYGDIISCSIICSSTMPFTYSCSHAYPSVCTHPHIVISPSTGALPAPFTVHTTNFSSSIQEVEKALTEDYLTHRGKNKTR
ncbi:hypothetical protein J6590_052514 [Homalodisca vitripennis]|nr:hypothetical protein J6590_052514 [Homalodisca vitripennis]